MEKSNSQQNNYCSIEEWKKSWTDGDVPFHKLHVHSYLTKYSTLLTNGKSDLKMFIPLCGKALSIKWLADQGHTVVGVEISHLAVKDFFSEQNIEYTEENIENFTLYKSKDSKIKLYCGDIYNFSSLYEGKFDAVWDQSALVAVNPNERKKYVTLIQELLLPDATCLVVTYDYDPSKFKGPPFTIPADVVEELYERWCKIEKLEERDCVTERRKGLGLDEIKELAFLLKYQKQPISPNPQADRLVTQDEWEEGWEQRNIGFHKPEIHGFIEKYLTEMTKGKPEIKIFVPLCGKSVDMKWLADQGHIVVGVEFFSFAIREFFDEQDLEYTQKQKDNFTVFVSEDERIHLYCGDLFDFSRAHHGQFDGIWDRGSLVAINPKDREKYARLMTDLLSPQGKCLLNVVGYNPAQMAGPPFSVPAATVRQLYEEKFTVELLEQADNLRENWRQRGLTYMTQELFILMPKK